MLSDSETRIEHVTLDTTVADPPTPVRIQPLKEWTYGGKRSSAGWAVVGEVQIYAFPVEVARPQIADWLTRHGYRSGDKGEWHRA